MLTLVVLAKELSVNIVLITKLDNNELSHLIKLYSWILVFPVLSTEFTRDYGTTQGLGIK